MRTLTLTLLILGTLALTACDVSCLTFGPIARPGALLTTECGWIDTSE